VTAEQRLHSFIGDELDVRRPAPAARRDEHRQPILPASNGREVGLQLAPGSVSNRISSSGWATGFSVARWSFRMLTPPG
jgi:hypothetical protein